jgi:hypothetical protein
MICHEVRTYPSAATGARRSAGVETGVDETLAQDRLDRLADALGSRRVQPGGPVPALWHWISIAPACATGTSVRVRLFRAPQAGPAVLLRTQAGAQGHEEILDFIQDRVVRYKRLPLVSRARIPAHH